MNHRSASWSSPSAQTVEKIKALFIHVCVCLSVPMCKNIHSNIYLKWINIKMDYIGNSSSCVFGENQSCIKIYSDVIKVLCLQQRIPPSHVHLFPKQLLDPITEWPNKVLSQQAEVRVKVDLGVCVPLRGEVGSKKGPLVLMELLWSWVDGYSPEILLLFFTWVRDSYSYFCMAFCF